MRSFAQLFCLYREGLFTDIFSMEFLTRFYQQSEQTTKLKEELAAPLRVMQEIARRIAKVAVESKLPVKEDDYVQSFKVELMDAVIQWCRGASFSDICKVDITELPFNEFAN